MNYSKERSIARLTGIWYLLLALSGMLGFMVYHPQVFIAGNPQATLENLAKPGAAQIRLSLELVIVVSQALAAIWFYRLFVELNKWAATALVIWGTVNAIVILISAMAMSTAIGLAGNSGMVLQEKLPLINLLSGIISNAWAVGGLFFGLWLLPMGYIIISSRCMPVWLGRVLLIGGAGYLLQTFANAVGFSSSYLGLLVLPATIGELWIVGYLLIYGIRPPLAQN